MVTCTCLQLVVLLAVGYPLFADDGAQQPQPELRTLRLLTLVLLAEHAGLSHQPLYHRGEEMISAAQLAVNKINMRDDILPGYKLHGGSSSKCRNMQSESGNRSTREICQACDGWRFEFSWGGGVGVFHSDPGCLPTHMKA